MAEPHLQVRLVAADRMVWSGEARMVTARTTEGDLGVLAGHAPLLGVLGNGEVTIRLDHGDSVRAAVFGGFLSVADDDVVTILAGDAQLPEEIDIDEARRALAEAMADAHRLVEGDEDALGKAERARTALRVAGVDLGREDAGVEAGH